MRFTQYPNVSVWTTSTESPPAFADRPQMIPCVSKNGKYISATFQLPCSGTMYFPAIGCIPLNHMQMLHIDGDNAYNIWTHSYFSLSSSQKGPLSLHQVLQSSPKKKGTCPTNIPVVGWGCTELPSNNLFLCFEDILPCIEKHPSLKTKRIFRGVFNGSWMLITLIATVDRTYAIQGYPGMSSVEKTILNAWADQHHGLVFDHFVNQYFGTSVEQYIRDLLKKFWHYCSPQCHDKDISEGKYAAKFISYDLPEEIHPVWFSIGRKDTRSGEYPLYHHHVQPDGSIVIPYPDFCNTWSDEARITVIQDFMKHDRSWMYMDTIVRE